MSDQTANLSLFQTAKASFPDLLQTFVGRLQHQSKCRTDAQNLARMPDHLLRDLGLSRSEVSKLVGREQTDVPPNCGDTDAQRILRRLNCWSG